MSKIILQGRDSQRRRSRRGVPSSGAVLWGSAGARVPMWPWQAPAFLWSDLFGLMPTYGAQTNPCSRAKGPRARRGQRTASTRGERLSSELDDNRDCRSAAGFNSLTRRNVLGMVQLQRQDQRWRRGPARPRQCRFHPAQHWERRDCDRSLGGFRPARHLGFVTSVRFSHVCCPSRPVRREVADCSNEQV